MRLLFDFATGDVVEMIDTTGQSFNFSDIKVLRSSGVLRQIRTAYELVDLVTIDPDHEFEIRLYAPDQYGALDPATGLYRLNADAAPFKVLNIKNPNYDSQDISETYITRTWGGRVKQWQFKYFGINRYWEVKVGEITASGFQLLEQQEVAEVQQSDAPIRNDYKLCATPNNNVLSHKITRYQEFSKGIGLLPIEKIQDPDKANLVQSMQYYTSGDRAGELRYQSEPDGDWSAYDYDPQDREILSYKRGWTRNGMPNKHFQGKPTRIARFTAATPQWTHAMTSVSSRSSLASRSPKSKAPPPRSHGPLIFGTRTANTTSAANGPPAPAPTTVTAITSGQKRSTTPPLPVGVSPTRGPPEAGAPRRWQPEPLRL